MAFEKEWALQTVEKFYTEDVLKGAKFYLLSSKSYKIKKIKHDILWLFKVSIKKGHRVCGLLFLGVFSFGFY